jgi:hypothetical protein
MDWLFIAMVFCAGGVVGATAGVGIMCLVTVGGRRV